MNEEITIAAAVVGILLGIAGVSVPWIKKRKALAEFGERKALSGDEFYSLFYKNSGQPKDLVLQLRDEVANSLNMPADKLRPEDAFGKQLGPYWITSEELDVLGVKAKNHAKSLGITVNLQKIHTLNDYILCFAVIKNK